MHNFIASEEYVFVLLGHRVLSSGFAALLKMQLLLHITYQK